MKFTKGYWMNLPGVTNTDAVQVREVKVENDRVYLYTVPYHADIRAMGGPLLEMYISSPQPDIIRTEAYHFMGSNQKMPAFELNDALRTGGREHRNDRDDQERQHKARHRQEPVQL